MQRWYRQILSSRKAQLVAALVLILGAAAAVKNLEVLPRSLPQSGILVLDLRHALPDRARSSGAGRSVAAVTVLRALDAARSDRRITGIYLRVGGRSMALAQAIEIADAVRRVRRSGKFAVAYSQGFTAANLSDRVLAAAADELWTERDTPAGDGQWSEMSAAGADAARSPQNLLWVRLRTRAAEIINAAAVPEGETATPSVDVVRAAGGLTPTQQRRGSELQAERSARAWGGAGSRFVDLLTYREALDRTQPGSPMVALVQADGILDLLEGPAHVDLAGGVVDRIRAAGSDPAVRAVIVRISTVAASDEALNMILQAADRTRRAGTPVGISFGPLVPASAATLPAAVPLSAPDGALLVNLAPGSQAAALAGHLRRPWHPAAGDGDPSTLPVERALLRRRAVVGTVTPGLPLNEVAGKLPEGAANPVPGASAPADANYVEWPYQVGSLLNMRDRLLDMHSSGGGRMPLLVPYEEPRSVWSKTKARLDRLRMRMTRFIGGGTEEAAE